MPPTANSDDSAAEQSGDDEASTYQKYRPQRKRKATHDPIEAELLKMLKDDPKAKDTDADEDRGFFLSLYNDFRRLPVSSSTKLKLKMELMQVIDLLPRIRTYIGLFYFFYFCLKYCIAHLLHSRTKTWSTLPVRGKHMQLQFSGGSRGGGNPAMPPPILNLQNIFS